MPQLKKRKIKNEDREEKSRRQGAREKSAVPHGEKAHRTGRVPVSTQKGCNLQERSERKDQPKSSLTPPP